MDSLAMAIASAVEPLLAQKMDEDAVRRLCEQVVSERAPTVVECSLGDGVKHRVEGPHKAFFEILGLVQEGIKNIMLIGPGGTGKTTLAGHLGEAFGIPHGHISLSGGTNETHILGRTLPDASGAWTFHRSKFTEIYENGGVFLFDEMDAAEPNVLVSVHAPMANGALALTDGTIIKRHPNCFLIGAMNTNGTGASTMYTARNGLDAATLDRFVLATVKVDYDPAIERRALGLTAFPTTLPKYSGVAAEPAEIWEWVGCLRADIDKAGLRRLASTRLVERAGKAAKCGRSMGAIKDRYFVNWSETELAKLSPEVR